jgi:hypothetical protein
VSEHSGGTRHDELEGWSSGSWESPFFGRGVSARSPRSRRCEAHALARSRSRRWPCSRAACCCHRGFVIEASQEASRSMRWDRCARGSLANPLSGQPRSRRHDARSQRSKPNPGRSSIRTAAVDRSGAVPACRPATLDGVTHAPRAGRPGNDGSPLRIVTSSGQTASWAAARCISGAHVHDLLGRGLLSHDAELGRCAFASKDEGLRSLVNELSRYDGQ